MTVQEFVDKFVKKQAIKRQSEFSAIFTDYLGFRAVFTHYDKKTKMDKFVVVMENETFEFGKGTGLRKNGNPVRPTITEFLLCISTDCQAGEMDFEEFCSEFGCDPDSRKEYKIWEQCKENKEKMERIFDPEAYEELLQIEEGDPVYTKPVYKGIRRGRY